MKFLKVNQLEQGLEARYIPMSRIKEIAVEDRPLMGKDTERLGLEQKKVFVVYAMGKEKGERNVVYKLKTLNWFEAHEIKLP